MYKLVNGELVELTAEEEAQREAEIQSAHLQDSMRTLTESDIAKMLIQQNINDIITDDATASRAIEFHPVLKNDNSPIKAGTRINWNGTLKRAAVDLWDTDTNNPDNAPTLWEDISYKDGIRVIPETITATLVFSMGELGYWGDTIYKSKINGNVYTPEQYADGWEVVTAVEGD